MKQWIRIKRVYSHQALINIISEFQEDEESFEKDTTTSHETVFDDAVSDFDDSQGKGMDSLSNTEEMYILFGDGNTD